MGKDFDDIVKTFAGIGAIASSIIGVAKLGGMVSDTIKGYYECPNCTKRYSTSLEGKSIKCSCGQKFYAN